MWLVSALCCLSSVLPFSIFLNLALVPGAGGFMFVKSSSIILGRIYFHRGAASRSSVARQRFLAAATCTAGVQETGGMIPGDAAALIKAVYEAKPTPQVCVTTTGSGGQAVSWLIGVPGASSCILEATVPYSMAACQEKMAAGPPAPGYCSPEAAEALARDAYARAVALCVAGSDEGPHALSNRYVVGVGCTAAVTSTHPRRGRHRCFVCAQTRDGLAHYQLTLSKGRRDRYGEDAAVSRVILQAISEASGVPVGSGVKSDHLFLTITGHAHDRAAQDENNSSSGASESEDEAEIIPEARLSPEPDAIEALMDGRSSAVLVVPRAATCESAVKSGENHGNADSERPVVLRDAVVKGALPRGSTIILPGSYNPLHRGHVGLLEAARALYAEKISSPGEICAGGGGTGDAAPKKKIAVHAVFEVSMANVDKDGLTVDEVRRRTRQFSDPGGVGWPYPVVVTRAPLFSQKARLFPGCTFVVGADTAKRIIDPSYYSNSQVEMVAALAEIKLLGCSFIVGGRMGPSGFFITLDDVLHGSGLPESIRCMFHGLDETSFREDLSSTSIRAGRANAGL